MSITFELLRQVSFYTLLSGFQFPWPPSCCQYQSTPFVVTNEQVVRRPKPTLVHPKFTVLTTKSGPQKASIHSPSAFKSQGQFTNFKFKIMWRKIFPHFTNHSLKVMKMLCKDFSLLLKILLFWGTLWRKSATRWFELFSVPMLRTDNQFARQNCFALPPWFPVALPCPSIDHNLSVLNQSCNKSKTLRGCGIPNPRPHHTKSCF